jgi:hypothetical protein
MGLGKIKIDQHDLAKNRIVFVRFRIGTLRELFNQALMR